MKKILIISLSVLIFSNSAFAKIRPILGLSGNQQIADIAPVLPRGYLNPPHPPLQPAGNQQVVDISPVSVSVQQRQRAIGEHLTLLGFIIFVFWLIFD
jgi:hypothetical protein